jgi:hypothetical protein
MLDDNQARIGSPPPVFAPPLVSLPGLRLSPMGLPQPSSRPFIYSSRTASQYRGVEALDLALVIRTSGKDMRGAAEGDVRVFLSVRNYALLLLQASRSSPSASSCYRPL